MATSSRPIWSYFTDVYQVHTAYIARLTTHNITNEEGLGCIPVKAIQVKRDIDIDDVAIQQDTAIQVFRVSRSL